MLRPTITLSYAQSLDGSIAARRGQFLPLSGEPALTMTHRLRAEHDAILVGIGTVLADNPELTVRYVEGESPQVVVLDSQLRTPLDANVVKNGGWIVGEWRAGRERRKHLEEAGATVRLFSAEKGYIPLDQMLTWLYEKGVRSLMVEGGARVITSFLRAGLVNRAVITISPQFVGGFQALEGSVGARLQQVKVSQLGDDIIIEGQL